MVVIRDGKLHKAGVGIGVYLGITDSVVKFSSKVNELNLALTTCTIENQNVSVTGYAHWTVVDTAEGAYKFVQNMQINEDGSLDAAADNVKKLCDGHITQVINNAKLHDMVKDRVDIKRRIEGDLKAEAKKLGIYVEVDLK